MGERQVIEPGVAWVKDEELHIDIEGLLIKERLPVTKENCGKVLDIVVSTVLRLMPDAPIEIEEY